jgi:hypothetical protein
MSKTLDLQALPEAQWINCDIRTFDMTVLGKFGVIMADPPWEIHQDLPYGTMADDEMRKLNIGVLQDDGVIFLWVTGAPHPALRGRACVCSVESALLLPPVGCCGMPIMSCEVFEGLMPKMSATCGPASCCGLARLMCIPASTEVEETTHLLVSKARITSHSFMLCV